MEGSNLFLIRERVTLRNLSFTYRHIYPALLHVSGSVLHTLKFRSTSVVPTLEKCRRNPNKTRTWYKQDTSKSRASHDHGAKHVRRRLREDNNGNKYIKWEYPGNCGEPFLRQNNTKMAFKNMPGYCYISKI